MRLCKKNVFRFWLSAACMLLLCLTIITGCSAKEEQVMPQDSQEMSAKDDMAEGMDANYGDVPRERVIRKIAIDLTNDGVEDQLSVYLTDCDKEKIGNVEDLVAGGEGSVQVVAQDGVTEDILYDRTFSDVHTGDGQLSLVTDEDNIHWKDSEKIVADEIEIQFLISIGAASREVLAGRTLVSGEDVIPNFKNFLQGWSGDAKLLVAAGNTNIYRGIF